MYLRPLWVATAALGTLEERTLRDVLDIKEEERRNMSEDEDLFLYSTDICNFMGEDFMLCASQCIAIAFYIPMHINEQIKSIKSVDVGVLIIIIVSVIPSFSL